MVVRRPQAVFAATLDPVRLPDPATLPYHVQSSVRLDPRRPWPELRGLGRCYLPAAARMLRSRRSASEVCTVRRSLSSSAANPAVAPEEVDRASVNEH